MDISLGNHLPGSLILATRYIIYYRGRAFLLVAALALTIYLPLTTGWMIDRAEREARQRAEITPAVVGAKGSRFGLVLHALYFLGESPEVIRYQERLRIEETGLAEAIPLHARFTARGIPIVGTSNSYFAFRNLTLGQGQTLQRLGDCILGSTAARRLKLTAGDRLMSDPQNMFDLSGPSPLNLRVTGILSESGTSDDEVIWCELRTAWIIEGIGHGHSWQPPSGDQEHSHSASEEFLQAYQEVTDENFRDFHFHGKLEDYPLTAILAVPNSVRSEALLLGKYLDPGATVQIVRPVEVIGELMRVVDRVRELLRLGWLLLIVTTVLLVCLVLLLSLRLRQREIKTMNLLGCSRRAVAQIIATEWMILLVIAANIAVILAAVTTTFSSSFVFQLLGSG